MPAKAEPGKKAPQIYSHPAWGKNLRTAGESEEKKVDRKRRESRRKKTRERAQKEAQVDKKKLFGKAQPHFVVRNGTCYYKDKPFDVNGAPCTASVADGASIS